MVVIPSLGLEILESSSVVLSVSSAVLQTLCVQFHLHVFVFHEQQYGMLSVNRGRGAE